MRQGQIYKANAPEEGDLKRINDYTRRDLTKEEVYVFNVILCDNEVDRDYESFTVPALKKLGELYLGKTGIFDHNPKGENQTARIYDTEVVVDSTQKTQYGQPYACLKAKAYMVRSVKTADLILEIDAGIKKEVSVGCAVDSMTCSICGANLRETVCDHIKGAKYQNELCYCVLDVPTDAYEWSFVAVPAQRNAGVVKAFETGGAGTAGCRDYEQLKKAFTAGEEITLSTAEQRLLAGKLARLEQEAELGKGYLTQLQGRVVKLSFLCGDEIDSGIISSVVGKMSLEELQAYECHYEKRLSLEGAARWDGVQLAAGQEKYRADGNRDFKI